MGIGVGAAKFDRIMRVTGGGETASVEEGGTAAREEGPDRGEAFMEGFIEELRTGEGAPSPQKYLVTPGNERLMLLSRASDGVHDTAIASGRELHAVSVEGPLDLGESVPEGIVGQGWRHVYELRDDRERRAARLKYGIARNSDGDWKIVSIELERITIVGRRAWGDARDDIRVGKWPPYESPSAERIMAARRRGERVAAEIAGELRWGDESSIWERLPRLMKAMVTYEGLVEKVDEIKDWIALRDPRSSGFSLILKRPEASLLEWAEGQGRPIVEFEYVFDEKRGAPEVVLTLRLMSSRLAEHKKHGGFVLKGLVAERGDTKLSLEFE
jgi:hypothetical protein